MIPETFAFIAELTAQANSLGMEVLVEIHSHYLQQVEIARRVDRVYDFALPPLVLHALFRGEAVPLANWLKMSPRNAITVLDTHDGIGVIDVGADAQGRPGLLAPQEIDRLVETICEKSKGESRQATGAAASNLDIYQVNCTYYDALGANDTAYLIARALQFFAPGIPQVYYTGLLAGRNDMKLLAKTNVGRDINRHYFTSGEIKSSLEKPVAQRLLELIRFRNTHAAFDGELSVENPSDHELTLIWKRESEWARLEVEFAALHAVIACSGRKGEKRQDVSDKNQGLASLAED